MTSELSLNLNTLNFLCPIHPAFHVRSEVRRRAFPPITPSLSPVLPPCKSTEPPLPPHRHSCTHHSLSSLSLSKTTAKTTTVAGPFHTPPLKSFSIIAYCYFFFFCVKKSMQQKKVSRERSQQLFTC